ncbi:polymorphic toxin-type HINT domain-containing protein [Cysteiniphilum litorale]|uniref:polymorphic toxin-type HINT domain-containing protein n=1 Tax=Cysteiniphilum litorale TaxID=2056700 RepID=UPI003F883AE3
MRKYFISMLFLTLPLVSSAHNYDATDINPTSWKQVELKYSDIIDGKAYPAEIKLLRPIQWLEENGIDQVGKRAVFSLPEFGIDQVEVTVTDITDTRVDTKDIDWHMGKTKIVIGTFKRYAQDVRTYAFKDEKGNIEQINATPNHPFYVVNQQAYVAIDDIEDRNELISQSGQKVRLVCFDVNQKSCGKRVSNQVPVMVYNIEVVAQHIYYVGKYNTLVHNTGCGIDLELGSTSLKGASNQKVGKFINQYVNKHVTKSFTRETLKREVAYGEPLHEMNKRSYTFRDNLIEFGKRSSPKEVNNDWARYTKMIGYGDCEAMACLGRLAAETAGFDRSINMEYVAGHRLLSIGSGRLRYIIDPWANTHGYLAPNGYELIDTGSGFRGRVFSQ